jgi:hypothetical protein
MPELRQLDTSTVRVSVATDEQKILNFRVPDRQFGDWSG